MEQPTFDSFEEEIAYYEARRERRRAAVSAALAVSPGIVLIDDHPKYPRRELVIVSTSTDTHPNPSGKVRISEFMVDGPWGHENVKDYEQAAVRIAEMSWTELESATDDDVIAWTSTPQFQQGVKVAAFIQAGNALRYYARGSAAPELHELERRANDIFQSDPDAAVAMLEDALRKLPHVPNPAHRPHLVRNPEWVTTALATSYDVLEEKVHPAAWLPRLEDVRPGPRGAVLANIKEYGCGAYGCVLPTLDPTVVLKVTTDDTETEFAVRYGGAGALADADVCVRYFLVVKLAARHAGRPIHLLWREAADHVGGADKVMGKGANQLVDEQQVLGASAYDALYRGMAPAVVAQRVNAWLDFLVRHSKHRGFPAIGRLFAGMAKIYREQHIIFGDVHSGNIGLVNGRWLIVDPGNIAVLDVNA